MGASADLDLDGTAGLIANGANNLTVGAAGTGRYLELTGGGKQVPISDPIEGTAATSVAGSGTITPTTYWNRLTTAGAVTGVIVAVGTHHGQEIVLTLDKDAGGTITMATAATSHVGTGTGCVIPVGGRKTLIWDNTDLIWAAS